MKSFTKLMSIILLFSLLTACGRSELSSEILSPGSVTIETYVKVSSETESESEEEPFYMTVASQSQPAHTTTVPENTTENSTTAPGSASSPESSETGGESYSISECSTVMYATSSVNIRQKPDADSKRLGHLDEGEKVSVNGVVSNGWYRIVYNGEECFVNGRYLTEEKPADAEPAKTTVTASETRPSETTKEPAATTEPTVTTPTPTTTTIFTEEDIDISEIEDISPQPMGYRSYNAINYDVQKAVWFAFLDIDPMLSNATAERFAASIREAFENVREYGCNTVYVHVRSHGDAYYFSDYYPFTAAYSGTIGVAPDFDPLEIMINEAHKLGLSFHAWVNPMRTTSKDKYAEMPGSYAIKQWYDSDSANGKYLVYEKDDGFYWLSPAYTAVRELICNGIKEIVSRYDVDGIHIDDYFYPTTDKSFDKAAFSVSGWSDLAEWRRETVSALVSEIYSSVKSCNQTVLFGVSPQGNMENNRNKLYADIERWCSSSGYLDYIVPQIYYGYSGKLPFDSTALDWQNIVTNPDIKLICGIAAYKVGTTKEWKSGDMLYNQTTYIDSLPGYSGCAYYRYDSMVSNDSYMKKERNKLIEAIAILN